MTVPERYAIRRIDPREAARIVTENHYLHRPGPCSFAFGLIDTLDGHVAGVITYGTPSSSPLRKGVCGPEHAHDVIELTRLWVEDGTPRNVESYLIGGTIRQVDKPIVVSYAEVEQGHLGIVYQATNWIYTGLSAKRTDWAVDGQPVGHGQTASDRYSAAELRRQYGDRFSLLPRPRKHRYVFLNCDRRRKRELLKKLRYPIVDYPKAEVAA